MPRRVNFRLHPHIQERSPWIVPGVHCYEDCWLHDNQPFCRRQPREWRPTPGFKWNRRFCEHSGSDYLKKQLSDIRSGRFAPSGRCRQRPCATSQVDSILGHPPANGERRYSRALVIRAGRRPPLFKGSACSRIFTGKSPEDSELESDVGKQLQDYSLDDFLFIDERAGGYDPQSYVHYVHPLLISHSSIEEIRPSTDSDGGSLTTRHVQSGPPDSACPGSDVWTRTESSIRTLARPRVDNIVTILTRFTFQGNAGPPFMATARATELACPSTAR